MAEKGRHARKSHKGIVIAIIVILLLGCGAGGYFYRDKVKEVYNSVVDKINENDDSEEKQPTDDVNDDSTQSVTSTEPSAAQIDPVLQKAQQMVQRMGENEKICQLFVVTPEQLTGVDIATVAGDTTKKQLAKYPVGGVVYFEQNKADDDSFKTMVKKTKSYSKTPLFIMENGEDEVFAYSAELKASQKLTKDSKGEKAIQAFKDGAKILIMPQNLKTTVKAFSAAVQSGEIDQELIDSAVTDIIKLKISKGIIK